MGQGTETTQLEARARVGPSSTDGWSTGSWQETESGIRSQLYGTGLQGCREPFVQAKSYVRNAWMPGAGRVPGWLLAGWCA